MTRFANFDVEAKDKEFDYEINLTKNLDGYHGMFNQGTINSIVLWKVNRYVDFDEKILKSINSVRVEDAEINIDKTTKILQLILKLKGVRLALASTFLRFRNPKIYQIIDQRIYRLVYNIKDKKDLKLPTDPDKAINVYLKYLVDLRELCIAKKIDFIKSDRIFYNIDKRINGDKPIN